MRTKLIFATGLLAVQLFAAPALALAATPCVEGQNGVQCPLQLDPNAGPDFIVGLINVVANWMFTILLITAVCFIVWAAYNYLIGEGEPEKVSAAHRALVYAAVAIVVAMLSRGFVYIIRNTVAGTNTPGNYYQGGTVVGDGTGGNGNPGPNNGGNPVAPEPIYSPVAVFTEFGVQVQVCSDNETPGVVIRSDETPQGLWANVSDENIGNPDISTYVSPGVPRILKPAIAADPAAAPPVLAVDAVLAAANAGEFTTIGTVTFGSTLGLFGGTDYSFSAEICNNGIIPKVMYNVGSNSGDWQQL